MLQKTLTLMIFNLLICLSYGNKIVSDVLFLRTFIVVVIVKRKKNIIKIELELLDFIIHAALQHYNNGMIDVC